MQTFEFTTELHDDVLSIPHNYKNWAGRACIEHKE